jgi:hypothetical protein
MDYMFLIYATPERMQRANPEEHNAAMAAHWSIMDDATERGVFKGAAPLEPAPTAVTVRYDGNTASATDDPYAETREVLGGYYVITCADAAEARHWAERISRTGCGTAVEFRAIAPIPARQPSREAATHANA